MTEFKDFQERFKLLASKNEELLIVTLGNIFTMRLIGNKTHGDLAEIGVVEFINQYMYDYRSKHVGKDLYRSKNSEEDIVIINELSQVELPISLKAYGDGPLQLSTDKSFMVYPYLENFNKTLFEDKDEIATILENDVFKHMSDINIMPLIYKEQEKKCNILIFDFEKAKKSVAKIEKIESGNGRRHPIYRFTDVNGNYIFEVRYGGASANALQRGIWTHTKNAYSYFDSISNGWIDYSHNLVLVKLFSLALNSREPSHELASEILQKDINDAKCKLND